MISYGFHSRWCCQLHCGPPGPGSVPSRSTDQENQGWASGKYVQAKKRSAKWTPQKDHGQPFAQEKKILTYMVDPPLLTLLHLKRDMNISFVTYSSII